MTEYTALQSHDSHVVLCSFNEHTESQKTCSSTSNYTYASLFTLYVSCLKQIKLGMD